MLIAPDINPIAFKIGPLAVHWYGLMYVFAFVAIWWLGNRRARKPNSGWTEEQVADVIFYGALGTILGGRLGYVLFYDLPQYVAHPLNIFKVWQGGMSFHGGLVGVSLALAWFAHRVHKRFFDVTDFVAPWVPIGLAAGRIGNFINQELWGRVTDAPWGMVFRTAGPEPRHPSQLYEFGLEGVTLFLILYFYSRKPRPSGATSAMFLLFYGIFRFIAEFFRQPDVQLGFVLGPFTMGQLLSAPMIVLGALLLRWSYKRARAGGRG